MTDVAKAGWLYKESSILKRWKKHWFALTIDGYFRQFESPNNFIAEKTLSLPNDVVAVKVGPQVDSKAPDDFSMDFLIKIVAKDNTWVLCAESVDDMLAWQIAIEQARAISRQMRRPNNNQQQVPPYLREVLENNPNNGYPTYYRGTYRGSNPSRIVHTPQGPITVVYVQPPYNRRYYAGDVAYGALAGTAIASSLMWPFWFPLFWC